MNQWSNPELAREYTDKATNPSINWYEYDVNLPDLLSLIPKDAQRILDFGSGPGDVTEILAGKFPKAEVEGCDNSTAMLDLAKQKFPFIKFFNWDGQESIAAEYGGYDCIFSKLTVHFVQDLDKFASQISAVLKPKGSFVFSVPHPMRSFREIGGESYWQQVEYDEEIGKYGITAVFIHRSIQAYFQPFSNAGFVLTGLSEPNISSEQIQMHNVDTGYASIPRRLNWRFEKS
jgi:trans-aconitate methyltransferase